MQTHRDGRFVLSCDSARTLGEDGSLPKPCPEEYVAPEGATLQDSLALSTAGGWSTVGASDTCPRHTGTKGTPTEGTEPEETTPTEVGSVPDVKQPGAGEAQGGTAEGEVATLTEITKLTEIKEASASQPEERVIPTTPALESGAVPA